MKVPLNSLASTPTPPLRSEDDHNKVLQTLYVVDLFAVSDEAYHELRMLPSDLPPLCRLKQAQSAINGSLQIDRLPTQHLGAYRPFRETLTVELTKAVSQKATLSL